MQQLTIDPEFQRHVPQLTDAEREGLRKAIQAEGCRDPVVVWNDVIVDGHNRYEICHEIEVPFRVVERQFIDRDEALAWMEDNQLSRRNLTDEQRRYFLGKQALRQVGPQGGDHKSNDHRDHLIDNTEAVAKAHGVSRPTVTRAAKFAKEVDADESKRNAVMAGERLPKKPKKPKKPDVPRETVPDGPSMEEIVAELQAEAEDLRETLRAVSAGDKEAEIVQLRASLTDARKKHAEAMDQSRGHQKREQWAMGQLRKIGELVNEDDPRAVLKRVREALEVVS